MAIYRDLKSKELKINEFTGDLRISEDVDAILGSVRNILMDENRQRFFQEPFNPHPKYFLFDPIDQITSSIIEERSKEVIEKYEPRVAVKNIDVIPNEEQQNYNILIELYIIPLEQTESFSTILERVR